jgi:hypothetical protein
LAGFFSPPNKKPVVFINFFTVTVWETAMDIAQEEA